jgi:predicted MFS family arabinose efflux permease
MFPHTENSARSIFLTILFTGYIAATYGFGVYLFPAMMPEMITDFAIGYGGAGAIASFAQVGFLLSSLVSGLITERIGATRLVSLSMLVCVVCLGLVPLAPNSFCLTVLLIIMGATSASVWVPMVAIVKRSIPARHQGKALGLISSGTAYGLFLNGFSIPFLLPAYGWQMVWTVSAGLSAVLLAIGLFVLRDTIPKSCVAKPEATNTTRSLLISGLLLEPRNLLIPAMMFLSGIAAMPTQNYLVALVQDELGYGVDAAANIWKAIGLIGMFGGFAMGIMADYISIRRALALSYALLAIAIGMFLHHGTLTQIYLGAAFFGLAFNAIFGLIPAYVSLTYPSRMTALIFGVSNVMLGLGAMTGNMIGGLSREATGSFLTIYTLAEVTATALFLISLMLGAKKRTGIHPE